MRGLAGKRVLVAGGSRGIGLAAAQRFAEEGCAVHLCGVDEGEVADAVAQVEGARGTVCDVSVEADVGRLLADAVDAMGGLDVVANNAGIARKETFLDMPAASWDEVLAVNLRGMFLVAQAAARHMVERNTGGAIVNMASVNGLHGEPDFAHYNASKGGVVLLTRTMAAELGPHGIRVNALCPGYIRTPLSREIDDDVVAARYVADKVPLGRAGTAEDVAAAYAFLASDDAAFVHGACLVVDGGQIAVM